MASADGVVIQCARVDRMPEHHVMKGSVQTHCCRCRQRVWLSKNGADLARSQGIKPVCDVCKPAAHVDHISPG